MNTRSQTNCEINALYEVNIDFDGASESWKSNKKYIGNGSYKYITPINNTQTNNKSTRCIQITKSGSKCKREKINNCEFCFQHKII
jgi:hypothetical protein